MARVSIGVPVFNGADQLRQSLECLRNQTFEDIEVLIGDNASTDGTAKICEEFAAADRRFRHVRRPENIGALGNFTALRDAAGADLFMWRAHDDLSSLNFVEALVDCFDRAPSTCLAVAGVRSEADDRPARLHPYREGPRGPRLARVAQRLFQSHASWIYGLWRRSTLIEAQDRVSAAYHHEWGWDHLCFLPVLLDDAVAGSNEAQFIQRIYRAHITPEARKARAPETAVLSQLRADFAAFCKAETAKRDWSRAERLALPALIEIYVDRRAHSRSKLWAAGFNSRLKSVIRRSAS